MFHLYLKMFIPHIMAHNVCFLSFQYSMRYYSTLIYIVCICHYVCCAKYMELSNNELEHSFRFQNSRDNTLETFIAGLLKSSNMAGSIANDFKSFQDMLLHPNISKSCMSDLSELAKPFINKTFDPIIFSSSQLGKMLDAWGKPGPRILVGNLQWLGAIDECESNKDFHYCRTYFSFLKSEKAIGRYGTCFPKSCNPKDVENILSFSKAYIKDIVKFLDGRTMCNKPSDYKTGSIITLVLFGLIVWLCLLATCADTLLEFFQASKRKTAQLNGQEHADGLKDNEESSQRINGSRKNIKGKSLMNILLCFSIPKNIKALLSTKQPKGAIGCINGIRFISMTWVILGHYYLLSFLIGNSDNALLQMNELRLFSFMPIADAYVSVDTFFLLGGLLVAYLTLRRIDLKGGMSIKQYLMYLLHRYLRLTPSLGVVILFYNNILPIILSGPIALEAKQLEILEQPCVDYWWSTLLYISNFYPTEMGQQCYGLAWYLANDMQFYIVSPAILIVFYKLDKRYELTRWRYFGAFIVTGILCVVSFIITATLIWENDYPRLITATYIPNNPRAAKASESQNAIYEKPYTRIPAYLVGLLLGYVFSRKILFKPRHSRTAKFFGWCGAMAVALAIIYGPWHVFRPENQSFMTDAENIFYGTFHRFAWSAAVAWVIYACHNKMGGWVDSFLSWNCFIPLGRLTYGAYLTHILVLDYEFIVPDRPIHFQQNIMAFGYLSTIVISYACAFILSIFVEQPVGNLEKILFS